MKKLLLCTFLSFVATPLFSQDTRFLVDVHVSFLKYRGDSIELSTPRLITVNTDKCSEIFSLGKVKEHELGMQVEILSSELGRIPGYVIGQAFYIKRYNRWELITRFDHAEKTVTPIAERPEPGDTSPSRSEISADDYDFKVMFNDDYYLRK